MICVLLTFLVHVKVTYTYCGENGSIAYLDHCAMSVQLMNKCKVLDDDDDPLNT